MCQNTAVCGFQFTRTLYFVLPWVVVVDSGRVLVVVEVNGIAVVVIVFIVVNIVVAKVECSVDGTIG